VGAGALSRRRGWLVAIVATLTMTVSYIDRQTIAALSPTVMSALDMKEEQYGWLTSAFSVAYLVGAPLAGGLLDRAGARMGLVVAVLAWSVVSAGHALVDSFAVLVAMRVLLGAAESPSFPGAAQSVRRALPAGDRSAGFGLIFTGSSIGAMVAPPLAIALLKPLGWRFAFLGTALCGLLWIPLWLAATSGRAREVLDLRDPPPKQSEKAPLLALLLEPQVKRAVVLVMCSAPALMFGINWYARLLARGLGVDQGDLGHFLWFPPLLFDLGAVGFGQLASFRDRVSGRVRSHKALCAAAALLCATLALVPLTSDPLVAVVLGGVSMAGGGGCYVIATADMLARTEHKKTAQAGGFCASSQSLAQIIASPLVGFAVDRTHSFTAVLVVLGLLVLPGALAWMAWPIADAERLAE
jgi:ACS family hexuronate transporter-like MFS transporter